jgi:uncharacterized protein HemX
MTPVKRRIRKHFGLTSKQVSIKSKRPWYIQWLLWAALVVLGYGVAFWQYNLHETANIEAVMNKNQSLQTELIKLQRKIQIEHAAQGNLQKELEGIQDEVLKTKEELLFYKNMVEHKK